ncbi:ASCH domain-containing protein [Myceligenerans cantabricum]
MTDDTREPEQHDETTGSAEEEFAADDDFDPARPEVEDADPEDAAADDFDPATFDPEDFAGDGADDVEEETAVAVQSFWEMVRPYAGMAKTGVVTGVLASETVPPPAWSFGDEAELADRLLELVVSGEKTATSSAAWDYEDAGEPLPEAGELSILLDGVGQPRALIRTTSVETVPFDEVDDDVAAAEGEGDRSLESWRTEHEEFFRRSLPEERRFATDMPVVVERFEVLYPKP